MATGLSMAAEAPSSQIASASSRQMKVNMVEAPAFMRSAQAKAPAKGTPKLKQAPKPLIAKSIKPSLRRAPAKASAPQGFSLFESFEGGAGLEGEAQKQWLPEGWSQKFMVGESAATQWYPVTNNEYTVAAPDGNVFLCIDYSPLEADQWLITPEVEVAKDEQLSFYSYVSPFFCFDRDNGCVDWDSYTFLKYDIISDVEVLAQADGGEWTKIYSHAEKYVGMSYEDMAYFLENLTKKTVDLDEFEGKKVRFAFRYYGTDANSAYLDAVGVGMPPVEGLSYMPDMSALYWGYDRTADWVGMTVDYAAYPVLSDINWFNMSEAEDATFTWHYTDPVTHEEATSDDQDMLTLVYRPDYTVDVNSYPVPVLEANAPAHTAGMFSENIAGMQAGGKAVYTEEVVDWWTGESTYTNYEFGLLPFAPNKDGVSISLIDAPSVGDMGLPVFGYNSNSDRYWLLYTLNGNEPGPEDDVRLTAIMNYMGAPSSPIVVTGSHVLAQGRITDKAEFTLRIVALDEEGVPDMAHPLASAVCKGSDVVVTTNTGTSKDMFNIPFDFDKPLVLDDSYQAYMVVFSGFRSPEVDFFAPVQSDLPNDFMCHGWLVKEIKVDNDQYVESYSPIARQEGYYGPMYNAFAIHVDGYYPWIENEVSSVELGSEPVEVKIPGYYNAADLTVEAPAGVVAKAEGDKGECVLKLSAQGDAQDGKVVVKAPGVETSIAVASAGSQGVNSVVGDNAVPVASYGIDGRRLSDDSEARGVRIVKYSDGSVRKQFSK